MSDRIILALDGLSFARCVELVQSVGDLAEYVYAFKIHHLWDVEGPGVVQKLLKAGAKRIKVDLKLHDIPETVLLRAKAVAESGAHLLTVQISGGFDMMYAALEAKVPELVGITVLTSLTEEDAHLETGQPSKAAVLQRARNAKLAGLPSIVCSPKEVGVLAKRRELAGMNFITPGVRSPGTETHDQQRVDTPANAFKNKATRIVVGREFTLAQDPYAALKRIVDQIPAAETA